MNAYQNFLDFFSMFNRERLDGLSERYFAPMTPKERSMAFDHLLEMMEGGGSDECVRGLVVADADRAFPILKELMKTNSLREEAKITAAWNLYSMEPDSSLLKVFIRSMSSPDKWIRVKAACYVPTNTVTLGLLSKLKEMVINETDNLVHIHAVNKLLSCYSVDEESVGKREYLKYYRGLCSEDMEIRVLALQRLDDMYE